MRQGDRGFRVVLVSAPAPEAAALARVLVSERLVACANIVPGVQSIYRWQGEVEEATEALIILKTSAELLPRLAERVAQLHSYEVPEVLALPVVFGTCAYLDWLAGSLLTNGVEDGA